MAATAPLTVAVVAQESERPLFETTCMQLAKALGDAPSAVWPVQYRLHESFASLGARLSADIVLVSMAGEVARDEPVAETDARWRAFLSKLREGTASKIHLCTVFRHVADSGPRHGAEALRKMERIRRLDLMAAHLSHDFGINLLDLDRSLAHIGARTSSADYRLANGTAVKVAGYAIASMLLDIGLDDAIPAGDLARARERQRAETGIRKALAHSLGLRGGDTDLDGRTGDLAVDAADPGV